MLPERRLAMVTYSDLFTFVYILCAVIALVYTIIKRKKIAPRPGRLALFFKCLHYNRRQGFLAFGSLVKFIIT